MEIVEYKQFLEGMSKQELLDYLYMLDIGELSVQERDALRFHLAQIKARKVLVYLSIFGFLRLIAGKNSERSPAVQKVMSVLNIVEPEIRQKGERPFDLVWVAQATACDECAAEDGKIYGKTTDKIPPLHPHCMCEFVKVYKEEPEAIKAMNIKTIAGGAVRAMRSDEGGMVIDVLAAPFGGPGRLDRLGQYLSASTDYMIEIGDRRPTLYYHGFSPRRRRMEIPPVLGIAEVIRIDDQGLWMRTELDDSELSKRTWEAAKRGEARASTGSIDYLVRPPNNEPGEVKCWPIAELSVFDGGDNRIPVSDDAVVIPLRALFEKHELEFDARFEAGEDKDLIDESFIDMEDEMQDDKAIQDAVASALQEIRAEEAAELEKEAAMRSKIEKELKESPNYRAVFNIASGDANTEGMSAEEQETHEYLWNLRHPMQAPRGMVASKRAGPYTETDAVEGLPLVPPDMLNRIWEKRDASSFGRKAGMTVLTTDKLILNIPAETTKMVALAAIAEEAVYTENVPALVTVPATVVKHGGFIDASEEFLEDQNLFQSFIVRAVGRAWGLAENVDVAALLATGTGIKNAAAGAMTDAEVLAWYFALDPEYRDEGQFFMGDDLLAYLRSVLITTPRAYGDLGFAQPMGTTPYETFLGKRVWTDANLTAIGWATAAINVEYANFCNIAEAYAFVERRGLKIMVDPYFQALNGIVRYYFSARWTAVKVNEDATALVSAHA